MKPTSRSRPSWRFGATPQRTWRGSYVARKTTSLDLRATAVAPHWHRHLRWTCVPKKFAFSLALEENRLIQLLPQRFNNYGRCPELDLEGLERLAREEVF